MVDLMWFRPRLEDWAGRPGGGVLMVMTCRLAGEEAPRRQFVSWLFRCALAAVLMADHLSAAQAGAGATPAATLTVAGDVGLPLSLTPAELKLLPRARVEIKENGGTLAYEGVLLGEILKRAGAPLGTELRGPAMSSYVVASATDGYQVLFSLAEVDPAFTSNDILVADALDGKALSSNQGPLRIVAPKDAHRTRSVRMLERIEVVRLRK
jgi:DMSO/TMAO reductase YedYZ molybdopterin-dependent catalytic subunit